MQGIFSFDKICEILQDYEPEDYALFRGTVDELCAHGIAHGCYQDYAVLCDVLGILEAIEDIIKNGSPNTEER